MVEHRIESDTRAWLHEHISGGVAAGIGLAWVLAYQLAVSLEPVTHRPEPRYGVVLGVAFLALIAATATGLVMQQRWGAAMSLAAATFFTAMSVACPVSGHHPFGAWWFGQMACALGMVGASWFALGRPAVHPSARTDVGEGGGEVGDPAGALSAGGAASPD